MSCKCLNCGEYLVYMDFLKLTFNKLVNVFILKKHNLFLKYPEKININKLIYKILKMIKKIIEMHFIRNKFLNILSLGFNKIKRCALFMGIKQIIKKISYQDTLFFTRKRE